MRSMAIELQSSWILMKTRSTRVRWRTLVMIIRNPQSIGFMVNFSYSKCRKMLSSKLSYSKWPWSFFKYIWFGFDDYVFYTYQRLSSSLSPWLKTFFFICKQLRTLRMILMLNHRIATLLWRLYVRYLAFLNFWNLIIRWTKSCFTYGWAWLLLLQVLRRKQPLIVYFPDSSHWLHKSVPKSNRNEFFQRVEEMFDQLSGPIILICGQNKVQSGSKEKEQFVRFNCYSLSWSIKFPMF